MEDMLSEDYLKQLAGTLLQIIEVTDYPKEDLIASAIDELTGEGLEKARAFVAQVQSEMECSKSD